MRPACHLKRNARMGTGLNRVLVSQDEDLLAEAVRNQLSTPQRSVAA